MIDIPVHKRLEREKLEADCQEYFKKKKATAVSSGESGKGKLKLEKSERKTLNRPLRGL